jgi:hypothetical protein
MEFMSDIQPDSAVEVEHRGQVEMGFINTVEPMGDSFDLLKVILQVRGEFRNKELFHIVSDGEKFRAQVLEIWTQGEIQKLVVRVEIPEKQNHD